MGKKPVLSIVAVSRNDDHGGQLLKRMQLFIDGIARQSERFRLHTELLIVEWNPPAEHPGLAEALTWPEPSEWLDIRLIAVSSELHRRYRKPDRLRLHQMIGKNVGIRRAQGDFVLATNIDILLTDELFEYLASGQLSPNAIYRADRFDVEKDIPLDVSGEARLHYCETHLIRAFHADGVASAEQIDAIYGAQALARGADRLAGRFWPGLRPHTNAAGDFQLMSRAHWLALRGYAEFDFYPVHVDALLEASAVLAGLEEQRLDPARMRVYHIDHAGSWVPQAEKAITARFDEAEIPSLSKAQFYALALELRRSGTLTVNGEHWGLGEVQLPEFNRLAGDREFRRTEAVQPAEAPPLGCETDVWIRRMDELVRRLGTLGAASLAEWIALLAGPAAAQVQSEPETVVVFGTGSGFEQFVKPALRQFRAEPAYFVDNDRSKWGSRLDGAEIRSPEALLEAGRNRLLIIVASHDYGQIREQLVSLGFEENRQFINGWYFY